MKTLNESLKKRGNELRKDSSKKVPKKVYPKPFQTKVIVSVKNFLSANDLLAMKFPDDEWVIQGLVPMEGITILSAPPANFKTWVMLQMGISIAKGENFLGEIPVSQGGVLLIDEENHLRLLQKRVRLLGITKEVPLHFMSQKNFSVSDIEWRKKVLDYCRENNIKTILIDSLVRIHKLDENSATDVSQVFQDIKAFNLNKLTVLLTHHERKEGSKKSSAGNRMRGSSDILAAIDSLLVIRKESKESNILVEHAKSRLDEQRDSFEIEVESSENAVVLKYLGIVQTENKELRARKTLIEILKNSTEKVSKSDLISQAQKQGGVGEKGLKKILQDMTSKGEVLLEQGPKNTKWCVLPKEMSEE